MFNPANNSDSDVKNCYTTTVVFLQFEYGFDDIGKRTNTKAGGNAAGSALRSASCSANTLNQYTSRTVPNAFDVLGASWTA